MFCEACQDTGWIIQEKDHVEFAVRCPECSESRKSKRRLDFARIPPRYQSKGFDVFHEYHHSQMNALKKAVEYVEAFPRQDKGLLLVGPCGVGKTHLAVAILKAILLEKNASGRFVDETEFLRLLHYSYGPEAVDTESGLMLPLMSVDLLVWDDLGTGRPTEWAKETIRMVLNHRYTYQIATVLTTNLNLENQNSNEAVKSEHSLEERLGTRMFSRLLEMCEIVTINGPDARKMEDQKRTGYPNSLATAANLIRCPHCTSNAVDIRDNKSKGRGAGRYIELSCLCKDCSTYFISRYFPRTSKIETME